MASQFARGMPREPLHPLAAKAATASRLPPLEREVDDSPNGRRQKPQGVWASGKTLAGDDAGHVALCLRGRRGGGSVRSTLLRRGRRLRAVLHVLVAERRGAEI